MIRKSFSAPVRLATLAALMIGASLPSLADVKITSELKDGDKVSDVAKVLARVDSTEGVDKVEFRVDDTLRYTDTSQPYVYDWDTLSDTEGEHTVTITGYDSNGVSKRITLKLVVDNEISSGAQALGEKAQEALEQKDEAAAFRYAKRSQKAEKGALLGSRVSAKIYASHSEWAQAIDSLEKASGLEENPAALKELAGYKIQRALRPENTNFAADFTSVAELRRKAAEKDIAAVKAKNVVSENKPTVEQITPIGDALLNNGKFGDAHTEYSLLGYEQGNAIDARRALSSVLQDKVEEGEGILRPLLRAKTDDAPVRAVHGLALLRRHLFTEARAAVAKDLLDQYPAALIVASYADSALGKRREALSEAKDVITLYPAAGEAYYAASLASADLRESDKLLGKALALSPFQPGPLNNYTARVAVSKRNDRYDQALNLTDLTLKYYPDNYFAKLIQAMVYVQTKKDREAQTALNLLSKLNKDAPETKMAFAVYFEANNNTSESARWADFTRKTDSRMDRPLPPRPTEYLDWINRQLFFRAEPFLSLDTLYPAK